eukprot:1081103-Rhodomonas_salina.1
MIGGIRHLTLDLDPAPPSLSLVSLSPLSILASLALPPPSLPCARPLLFLVLSYQLRVLYATSVPHIA